jgi:hypothetical protein
MYIDPSTYAGDAIYQEVRYNIEVKSQLDLIAALKPKFSMDGNQFCFLYGEMPNDCVVGFGETPAKAMENFWNSFYNSKAHG